MRRLNLLLIAAVVFLSGCTGKGDKDKNKDKDVPKPAKQELAQ